MQALEIDTHNVIAIFFLKIRVTYMYELVKRNIKFYGL